MKKRIFTFVLAVCLLGGAMCGCDYIEDTTNTGTTTAIFSDIDETDDTTLATTVTTTTKLTTKATTTTRRTTTTNKVITTTTTKRVTTATPQRVTEKPAETMVWIPASGSKYHSKSSCSNMKNPSKVTKSYAIEMGYTACKRCY